MSESLTGGMVVSRALARYGIRTVFALGGASHTHLLDALDRDGFTIVSGRHESGVVGAADGYARITGRIGVALIIADQGLPNAMNGIAGAFHAASPVLVLVARLPDSWTEAEFELDNAKHSLVAPVTKWARSVPAAERLAEYVDVACKRALSGRPGPVVLQVQQEFFAKALPDSGAARLPPPMIARAAADPTAIEAAAGLLRRARRPLLIGGAGATRGGAGGSLRTLSERYGLPYAGNGLGRGLVPEDWQRSFSWPLMQVAAKHADVVCVFGARLKQRLGYGLPPRFAADAKFVQVDVEHEELSRNRRIDVPIAADAGLAAAQLVDALADSDFAGAPDPSWVRDALRERFDFLDGVERAPGDAIHPLVLGRELAAQLPQDAIVVGDGADVLNWMYGAIRIGQAPGYLDHYPMGAMGSGTPLAVGAAAAAREIAAVEGTATRRVVLVTGDGSFGFYPAELHAAASAGLPLTVVIGNDDAWGTELHGQVKAIGRTLNTELAPARYELIGQAFGGRGERVEKRGELRAALVRALADPRVSVLDVGIDRGAGAQVKSDPRAQMIMFDDLASNLKAQHAFAG